MTKRETILLTMMQAQASVVAEGQYPTETAVHVMSSYYDEFSDALDKIGITDEEETP